MRRALNRASNARAGDLLRINFNISFPHLACQYASVDLSDVLGMVRRSAAQRHRLCALPRLRRTAPSPRLLTPRALR